MAIFLLARCFSSYAKLMLCYAKLSLSPPNSSSILNTYIPKDKGVILIFSSTSKVHFRLTIPLIKHESECYGCSPVSNGEKSSHNVEMILSSSFSLSFSVPFRTRSFEPHRPVHPFLHSFVDCFASLT